jgi:hypothetical protein
MSWPPRRVPESRPGRKEARQPTCRGSPRYTLMVETDTGLGKIVSPGLGI